METADIGIIGGGIVGLATAHRAQQRWPRLRVCVLEKEAKVGLHQSGRNSGVLHSGIYYTPGSLKAANCHAGKNAMEQFCRDQEIPFETCGKVIVAVDAGELEALDRIHQRGQANGVACERIGPERLAELEPHAAGVAALHVPGTGIVDFAAVCDRLSELVQQSGGHVYTGAHVDRIERDGNRYVLQSKARSVRATALINCAGLYSDRVTALTGMQPAARIVPFRGEYYELKPESHHLCRNLIYPVPDPKFPFLGVHFTRMIRGGVECGPNAVFALAREGYRWSAFRGRDVWESLQYRGFLKLARKYWRVGLGEMHRSVSKRAFVAALQHLIPEIAAEHLAAGRAGVRAQAVTPDGKMVDDFLIQQEGPLIHVANAPSPAATSSLQIGATIVERLSAVFD